MPAIWALAAVAAALILPTAASLAVCTGSTVGTLGLVELEPPVLGTLVELELLVEAVLLPESGLSVGVVLFSFGFSTSLLSIAGSFLAKALALI